MHEMTHRFIDALRRLHADGDPDPLVALFSSDATLFRLGADQEVFGSKGARRFWADYRSAFEDIDATVTSIVAGEDSVALEWISTGSLRTGRPVSYRGVSVLEGDEQEIRSFRTYYDPAALLGQPAGA